MRVEGSLRHQKLERKDDSLTPADEVAGETIHSRSVTLSSDTHRLIAKMDLIEGSAGMVTPVDYKRGAPRESSRDGSLEAWDTYRVHPQKEGNLAIGVSGIMECQDRVDFGHRKSFRHLGSPSAKSCCRLDDELSLLVTGRYNAPLRGRF